ncbi:hypothetical protein DPMN_063215 [Dreissena polymorpha]|uniref:Uncharacterized protein n=1 Tax=Dreissena polymorpha TaxID=45954 RepID=A0A9D4HK11_DREPO|nr:hypothetical protein DPMN_063215 [Dreissena polymorpha]
MQDYGRQEASSQQYPNQHIPVDQVVLAQPESVFVGRRSLYIRSTAVPRGPTRRSFVINRVYTLPQQDHTSINFYQDLPLL